MKIKVNKNILWAKVFIEYLTRLGVKTVCISPGSRSTPLTYAAAINKKLKSYVFADERSSGFFALGAARQSNSPVLVITTSGTAVAELYPAIIEAYKSRVPLIICTADRPSYLRNKGANQTINQKNIYKNHIRFFAELPLPSISVKHTDLLKKTIEHAYNISLSDDPGPIHLNFPFEKPFEPENFTDEIGNSLLKGIWSFGNKPTEKPGALSKSIETSVNKVSSKIAGCKRGIIFCGGGNYDAPLIKLISRLASTTGYPVVADGSTGLRFGNGLNKKIIENYSALCRTPEFLKHYDPELIIQFGTAPTSISVLEFYKKSKAEKYLINAQGDWHDPSSTARMLIKCSPYNFCAEVLRKIKGKKFSRGWYNELKALDLLTGKLKSEQINNAPFPFEGRIVNEVLSSLPGKCNLVISNSLPVRDFDSFASSFDKEINVYTNRGASGIDGIISTSLGIASQSHLPTYLVIGDLAFYHDLNALALSSLLDIPLQIILINNNGGGIFEHLPIAKHRDLIETFFKVPMNLDFGKIIDGYGCGHQMIRNWTSLRKLIKNFNRNKLVEVLEIRTDSVDSFHRRNDYLSDLKTIIE